MDEDDNPNRDQPESDAVAPVDVPKDPPPTQPVTEQQLQDAEQKIENKIEERMTAFERSMIRLTRYGLAVTVLTAFVFGGQLYEMISGGTQTDKLVEYAKTQTGTAGDIAQSASDQADAAQQFSDTAEDINSRMSDAVDQLQDAATNAKKSITATQNAMRLDQRAWVVLKGIGPNPQLGQGWIIEIHFTNTGRTPAMKLRDSCRVEPAQSEDNFTAGMPPLGAPTILAPNGDIYCGMNPLAPEHPKVDQSVLDEVANPDRRIFVHGYLTYEDIFRGKHWLTFCSVMQPDGKAWDSCKKHNETGDGDAPTN